MTLNSIFLDPGERLRSGWRLLVFLLAFAAAGTLLGAAALGTIAVVSPAGGRSTAAFLVVNGLASLVAALVAGWLCTRFLERLPFRALGAGPREGWMRNLAMGLLIGGSTFTIAALVGMAGGGLTFRPNTDATPLAISATLALSFAIFAAAGAFEEALFRGYILQTFVRSDLTAFALVLTSALFATVHNANPSATVLSWVNTFLAGIWFAVAYLKSRDLWLPFGLHLAWNWVQGSIFGVEVSGLTDIVRSPLLREADAGPSWLTGGDYGLEGGAACTIAILLSTLAVHLIPLPRPSYDMLALTSPRPATPPFENDSFRASGS